jgi:DnaJ-class molecular chaperone
VNGGFNYYELLGVRPSASLPEIRDAYHDAIRSYHPDVNKAANATQITVMLNQAWSILCDRDSRALYDREIGHTSNYQSKDYETSASDDVTSPRSSTVVTESNAVLSIVAKLLGGGIALVVGIVVLIVAITIIINLLPVLLAVGVAILILWAIFGRTK